MEMINEHINGVAVLRLSGRLDAYAAPAVKDFFGKINTDPLPYIIINFSNINFIDSTGLATLLIGMKRCRQQNGELVLCGLQSPVRTIFELTRLDKVFSMSGTQEEAIENIHHRQKG